LTNRRLSSLTQCPSVDVGHCKLTDVRARHYSRDDLPPAAADPTHELLCN